MKKHLFLSLFFLLGVTFTQAQSIYYVMEASTGGGASWSDPGDLQAMITKSVTGDQIWVAAGTYQPVVPVYFELKEGVKVYGGFTGIETDISQRNWKENISILKGIGTGNLVVRNYINHLTSVTLLDGFTVTGADRPSGDGGGIYNNSSSPSYKNCIVTGNVGNYGAGVYNKASTSEFTNVTIMGNSGLKSGAGMYNDNSSPTLTNVIIKNNTAGEYGGGIRNHLSSSPTLVNVLITANQSVRGGGIYNSNGSNPILTNFTISGNTATHSTEGGGGIYNLDSSPIIKNGIIWGNLATGSVTVFNEATGSTTYSNCLIEAGVIGAGIVSNSDPLFVNVAEGNYALLGTSPAINAGNNEFVAGVLSDLAGNPRIAGNLVDLGAYEYNSNTSVVNLIVNDVKVSVYPNPVVEKLYIQAESSVQEISFYDVIGRKVKQINPVDNYVNVTDLKTGMYLVNIITAKGQARMKICKE